MFARQPCDRIPRMRDVGQWLCVPPFRVVCLYQAFTLVAKEAYFTRMQQRWYRSLDWARRALGTPDSALDYWPMACRFLSAGNIANRIVQSKCHHESDGHGLL